MNNRKHFFATLICSGAIVASVNVIAQSYGQDSRQRSDTGRGTTMSNTADTRSESANAAFKRLDANKRGYLTNEEVRSMQGFDSACDKNTDGRITRSEFRPCWDTWSQNQSATPSTGTTPSTNNPTTGAGAGTTGTGASPNQSANPNTRSVPSNNNTTTGSGTGTTGTGSTGNTSTGSGSSGMGTSGSGTPSGTVPGAMGSGSNTGGGSTSTGTGR